MREKASSQYSFTYLNQNNHLCGEPEGLGDGQQRLDEEEVGALDHVLLHHAAAAPRQHAVQLAQLHLHIHSDRKIEGREGVRRRMPDTDKKQG